MEDNHSASYGGETPLFSTPWYVYILECNDHTHYTGCTINLSERISRHQNGYVHYTMSKLPVRMIFYAVFPDKYKAYLFEKYLKSGSGRAFSNKHLI